MADIEDDPQLSDADRVSLWLMSADGQRAVARTCQSLRLPAAFDTDLVVQVCRAADRMVEKGEPIESAPAFATRTLRLRAMSLLASPRSSRARNVVAGDDGEIETDRADGVDRFADVEADLRADEARRRLAGLWPSEQPWALSAALTVMSVLYDGAVPGTGCPTPVGGASEIEAAHWSGLWYAGRHDLFPGPNEPGGNTLTKRRSRAATVVKDVLRSSASDATTANADQDGDSRG